MTKILLVQPWNFHDEGITDFDLGYEWRNGPYNILLLATILNNSGHEGRICDLAPEIVRAKGDRNACLAKLESDIRDFRPDIIGISFFSVHYFEAKACVTRTRDVCGAIGVDPMIIAGGIHATVSPETCLGDLGFDYAFAGEGDIAIRRLADGEAPNIVPGLISNTSAGKLECGSSKGEQVPTLDKLPFPDWSLCDHRFYAYPSYGHTKCFQIRSLDMVMGRGCVYR